MRKIFKTIVDFVADELVIANAIILVLFVFELSLTLVDHPVLAVVLSSLAFVASAVYFAIDRGSMACFYAVTTLAYCGLFFTIWLTPAGFKLIPCCIVFVVAVTMQAMLTMARKDGRL